MSSVLSFAWQLLNAIAGLNFVSFCNCASTVSSGEDSGSLLTASAA